MLCDECNKNEATFHSVKIINGMRTERHLCAECQSKSSAASKAKLSFSGLPGLFANFAALGTFPDTPLTEARLCGCCGTSAADFLNTGFLGCDRCYTEFSDIILPVVQRVQSGTHHKGRSPESGAAQNTEYEYERLRLDLARAVETENYEEASVIRDKMRALKE